MVYESLGSIPVVRAVGSLECLSFVPSIWEEVALLLHFIRQHSNKARWPRVWSRRDTFQEHTQHDALQDSPLRDFGVAYACLYKMSRGLPMDDLNKKQLP